MLIDNSHHHHHHHNHHHNHRYYQQQQHQQEQQQTQQQQSLTMNNEQKDVNNNDCNRKRLNVNSHHHSYHRQQQQQINQLSPAMMTMTNTTNENMVRNHHHQQSVFRSQTLPCRKLNINNNNLTCDSQYRNRNRCSFNENHHHNQQFNCQSTRQQQQQQSMCNVNDQNNNMSKSSSTVTTTTNQTSSEQQQQCSINATMTIRRLLQLYEMGEYHEAANIISRLPYQTFRSVVLDLPVDIFVEAIPSSLPILDALYAKIFFSGRDLLAFGFKFLHPENVVSNMIKMFAICDVYSHPTSEESISICKKLLKVILIADPSLRKQLLVKKALIDRAVEGMGHHGLVGTSNDALMNLHEALRLEFERVIQQYKGAIAKIDELSSTNKIGKDGGPITRSLSQGPAPTFSSHQRLLSLKQEEIQDRLNKNRSLLCALEPCFRTNHSLQILLAILQKRIDYDKETLFQFGQLSREYSSSNSSSSSSTTNNNSASSSSAMSSSISSSSASGSSLSPSNTNNNQHNSTNRNHKAYSSSSSTILSNQFERDSVVAPVLMRFSHGCNQVLNLLKEIQNENGTIENDENTNEQQQQQQQQILLKSQCPTTTNTGGSSNGNCNNNNEIVKNQSTIIESQTSTTSSCIASTTTSTLMTTAASTKTANNHQLNHGNNRLNNQQQICLNDYLNKTTLVDVHQQSPVNISQSTTATTATTTTNDDSSDISGYHSDSDMSPISLQSPLASNNNRLPNNIQSSSNRMSTNKDNTNNKSNHHFSQQQHSSFSSANNTFNHQSNLKSEPDIAIMTGNSDSTTILDGQVRINSGDSENSNNDNQQNICCSSINNDDLNDDINTDNSDNIGTNSICRIEIDGKTMLKNDNFNHDENEFKLKLELLNARKRIDELEKQNSKFERRFSSSSLLLQSNYLNFDLPNQPNNNHINNLLQHYDYLYSQVRTDVIDALNQFDELKDSNELKIKLIFSIIVLAHRSAEQTFKDLYLNLRKLLKFDLNSDGDCIKNNDNNNDIDDDDCHRLLPIKIYYEQIETSIRNYLCITSAYFDIEPNVQNVCQQIWDTLYDYPCLERCTKLIDFIRQCVRFCWSLIVQHSDIKFDIETKNFRNDWHIRTVDSNVSNTLIKCYLWPTLFQHDICVHKGIVIT